ncbi:MAG: MGMT family protein [Candidatus Omnitrophica bacterium]|nr:MGMT family protein [Candidatus Omnitrophota bacterium]
MTNFERKVLKVVCKIPLGQVRSYKWVAEKSGRPKAYRAVANVLAKNPFPLLIPCHRVVRSDSDYGGYSLGRELKRRLINLEKKIKDVVE